MKISVRKLLIPKASLREPVKGTFGLRLDAPASGEGESAASLPPWGSALANSG